MTNKHESANENYQRALWRATHTPVPAAQKFAPGVRVRVADDLGPSMFHFPAGCNATVMHTYAHAYSDIDMPADLAEREAQAYCLDIDGHGPVSWYKEHQLTELEDNKKPGGEPG